MEEIKKNDMAPEQDVTPAVQEQSVEPAKEAAPTQVEPAAEPTKGAAPAKQTRKASKKSLSFGKIFLAALLATVAGSVGIFVLCMMLISGVGAMFSKPAVLVPEKAILHIDLAESIVDAPTANPMSSFDIMSMDQVSELTLFDALRAIEAAGHDERIEGIYLNYKGGGAVDITTIEELREAIKGFKAQGKWVVAYNDTYTQGGYFLATVADKIFIQPEGSFDWSGLAMNTMFYKGLIDKLGVEVDILRPTVCKYKSAVEPFFLDKMSEANRLQTQELVDQIWAIIVEAVADTRGISKEDLNTLADELAVVLPKQAVEHKFVDGMMYADQIEELFKTEYKIEKPEYVTLSEYASCLTPDVKRLSAPKVAIVYANGEIVDGEGTDKIYGYTLSKTIRKVAEDDDIKSVVLRVNSPGGSALASDIIWREVEQLKAKKPVIVSMGSYAASGGYYISAPADAIVTNRSTLTGSIGVFGMIPSVGNALKKNLGVTIDGVKSNKNAGMANLFNPMSTTQHAAMMQGVDRVYDRFTSIVAQGRNLTQERVFEIAEGRVWSGEQAQKIGLADTCGGLNAALAIAVDKAELGDNYQIVEVLEQPEGIMAILNSLNLNTLQQLVTRSELGKLYNEYKQVEELIGKEGIYARCPYIYTIE